MTDIDFGRHLWRSLRKHKTFPIQGALWLFQPDINEWHLLLATPRVDEIGPRKAYEELAPITRRMREALTDQLLRIVLISPNLPLYQALRSVFGETRSVEGARLGNTQVGGMYVNDAYLYEIR